MARIHPVAAILATDGKSQRWLIDTVIRRKLLDRLSKSHLSQVLSGSKAPSKRLAIALSRALSGRVRPEAIVFWKPPTAARKAAA